MYRILLQTSEYIPLFLFLEKLIWPKIAILLYAMGKYLAKMSKFIIKITAVKYEKLPSQMGKSFDRIEKNHSDFEQTMELMRKFLLNVIGVYH